ncbi:DUF4192 domain-containing protein [Nocardia terpenica]|nr:DUF4192 domain-containing protein [Nocardia terpenica]NQE93237.1 DUF4192 domain-containing protein [Nocardia terpenica]
MTASADRPADNDAARVTEDTAPGYSPPDLPRYDCARGESTPEPDWRHPLLRVEQPAEFIAAIPALLGFVPERSLVVCLLQDTPERPGAVFLGAVARHDLDVSGCGAWVRVAGQLAAICVQERAVGVVVLVVDDRASVTRAGRPGARASRHRDLIRALGGALRAADVTLADAWAAREIATGAPWWSLTDPERTGTQQDPSASPVTLAHVLDGRPIRSSRAELLATVEVDRELRDAVAAELEQAELTARRLYRRAVSRSAPGEYRRAALEMVLWQIAAVGSAAPIPPDAVADVAVALRDSTVRDALFALAVGEHGRAAEELWTRLCRALDGPDRAEAATLLGYSAYIRGDGPLAGVALEAALEADPSHGIAGLLETALRTGMHPQEMRKLARSGALAAAGLGVDLGVDPAGWQS